MLQAITFRMTKIVSYVLGYCFMKQIIFFKQRMNRVHDNKC